MTNKLKTIDVKVERKIPAPVAEVFDGWLNPKIPGNPWHIAEKYILNPTVDGLFFWNTKDGCHHYGRFTKVERPARIDHTWVSPNTLGEESQVTVTFNTQGEETLMTILHTGLPDTKEGRGHEEGWNYFLGALSEQFALRSRGK